MIVCALDELLLGHSGLQDVRGPRGRRLATRPQRKTKLEDSLIAEFQPFELRPSLHEPVKRHVLPIGEWSYWLAVLAFHRGGSAWERSASRHTGPFDVPQFGLAFDLGDEAPETSVTAGDNAMVLSVLYA
jgi:hypothetical protein